MNKEEKEIMNKMIYCNLINHIEDIQKENERLNNIINKLEKVIKENIKYLEHLDKIGAMCSTQEQRFNKELLEIIERR